jgi:hypothetical protein
LRDFVAGYPDGFHLHRPLMWNLRSGFVNRGMYRYAVANRKFALVAVQHGQGFGFFAGDGVHLAQIGI